MLSAFLFDKIKTSGLMLTSSFVLTFNLLLFMFLILENFDKQLEKPFSYFLRKIQRCKDVKAQEKVEEGFQS